MLRAERLSRPLLDSVERIKENEEKDAPKRKIKAEKIFSHLKIPPLIFAPLFGEVSRKIYPYSPRQEQRETQTRQSEPRACPNTPSKVCAVAVGQHTPKITETTMKGDPNQVRFDAARPPGEQHAETGTSMNKSNYATITGAPGDMGDEYYANKERKDANKKH